jgi:hypothetical protein
VPKSGTFSWGHLPPFEFHEDPAALDGATVAGRRAKVKGFARSLIQVKFHDKIPVFIA